ncbi:MAG: hypothetical protein JWM64_1728 [Frankiales bacterium]|nr:hypothetical protein [Frankiales bacterium]
MVDVEAVRGLARQVAGLADATRATASRTRDTHRVQWQSVAAERWRQDLAGRADGLEHCAADLDAAARALHAHADAVEHRLAQVAAAERAFGDLLDRARTTVAGTAHATGDAAHDAAQAAAERLLAAARSVPGPGSLSWPGFLSGLH